MSARALPRRSFKSSQLSRDSAEVFAVASDQPVQVSRRDGESLVLMSESYDNAREKLLRIAGQLIAVSLEPQGTLAERMRERFEWMYALTDEDQEECALSILRAARASFATGEAHKVMSEILSWKETATALAAGLGAHQVEWLEEMTVVERP